MRPFKGFPTEDVCSICGTNDQGECVLAALDGTQEDNIAQAVPLHLKCIELRITRPRNGEQILYQRFEIKEKKND